MIDNLDLGLVGCGDFNEDVLGVERDLAVISVDNWRQREDCSVGIVDYGVYWRVADDMEETAEMLVFLLEVRYATQNRVGLPTS